MKKENRTHAINVKLNDTEFAAIKLIKATHKVSFAKLVRQSILFYSANYQPDQKIPQ